jgi:hypothetical protein
MRNINKLVGWDVVAEMQRQKLVGQMVQAWKRNDPIEHSRVVVDLNDAIEICRADPSLLVIET